ncbi:MAG TPA: copper resistance protein CopC [Acidobacteriaceae bacterium]|nr:copper resistance protein CopC [Acidobacteriaceae bacterium]
MKLLLFPIAALALSAGAARAQGCAQCRDDVRAAPLPVQQAYRHAIELLAISGLGVFAGGVLVLRRYR